VSVTADNRSRQSTESRNDRLLAEITHDIEQSRGDTRFAAIRDALELAEHGRKLDDAERNKSGFAWRARRVAYSCDACDHVFTDGDVVYRKWYGGHRMFAALGEYEAARLMSICDDCVDKMHESWRAAAAEPVPCDGGCGVLVSGFPGWNVMSGANRERYYRTCSEHCSHVAQRERRLVHHDERICASCKEPFVPKRSDARYCSHRCRVAAHRRRRKAEDDR
jgi:hypothetical protein